jgi:hypothetical protein
MRLIVIVIIMLQLANQLSQRSITFEIECLQQLVLALANWPSWLSRPRATALLLAAMGVIRKQHANMWLLQEASMFIAPISCSESTHAQLLG